MKISKITHIINTTYKDPVDRSTVHRNILKMEDAGLICARTDKHGDHILPKAYWLDPRNKVKFDFTFEIEELQIILWAVQNIRETSSDFFHNYTSSTISKILEGVPEDRRSELKESMRAFTTYTGVYKKPFSFPKNNLNSLIEAIRKRKYIRAVFKYWEFNEEDRHLERTIGVGNITFKNNIPYLTVVDKTSKDNSSDLKAEHRYKSIRATRLNKIKILESEIPAKEIKHIRNFDHNTNRRKIRIKATGVLAQILKESILDQTQERKIINNQTVEASFDMRVSNSFINLLLPHVRDIISISPKSLKVELLNRTKENLKSLNSL